MVSRRKAFTLVELLVVIGIIALLISILLPSLNRARESAKRVVCESQLRQVYLGYVSYAANNHNGLPPLNQDTGASDWDIGASGVNNLRFETWQLWGDTSTLATLQGVNDEGPDFKDPRKDNPKRGSNAGRLFATNYLKGDIRKVLFCPSTTGSIGDDITGANNPNFYLMNVHLFSASAPTLTPPYCLHPCRKLNKYKRPNGQFIGISAYDRSLNTAMSIQNYTYAFGSDPLYSNNSANNSGGTVSNAPHLIGSSRVYNLVYTDGSVRQAVIKNSVLRQNLGSPSSILDLLGAAESAADNVPFLGFGKATGYYDCPIQ